MVCICLLSLHASTRLTYFKDNPINQTILSTFMRRKKIKYDLASNGHEAVQKWRTGGFHLILVRLNPLFQEGALVDVSFRWTFRCQSWTEFKRPRKSGAWRS